MPTIQQFLLILAAICFFLAMIGVPSGKELRLIAAGLFLISIALAFKQ
jgi:hypothetical protein